MKTCDEFKRDYVELDNRIYTAMEKNYFVFAQSVDENFLKDRGYGSDAWLDGGKWQEERKKQSREVKPWLYPKALAQQGADLTRAMTGVNNFAGGGSASLEYTARQSAKTINQIAAIHGMKPLFSEDEDFQSLCAEAYPAWADAITKISLRFGLCLERLRLMSDENGIKVAGMLRPDAREDYLSKSWNVSGVEELEKSAEKERENIASTLDKMRIGGYPSRV